MHMLRMDFTKFLSYVLDQRKKDVKSRNTVKVFYHIPIDAHGKTSSFVFMVLLDGKTSNIFCAGSKCNPVDDTFDTQEGLKQAANRLWREWRGMKSLYGKDHGPAKTKVPMGYPILPMLLESMMLERRIRAIKRPVPGSIMERALALGTKLDRRVLNAAKKP